MKIGDEVYIHGFVDEIRKDTVIIRNKGGYFGTDAEEVAPTVERKKGKWDFIGFQMFRCTACKHVFSQDSLEGWRTYTYEPTFPIFCPNCGAEMEPSFGNKLEK